MVSARHQTAGIAPARIGRQRSLEAIYDYLYANGRVKTPQRIAAEVVKVISVLLTGHEAHSPGLFAQIGGKSSQVGGSTRHERWKPSQVREAFRELNSELGSFETSEIELSDPDMGFILGHLQDVSDWAARSDVVGEAVEVFRSHWAKRHGGQFFTDQAITKLAVSLVGFDPRQGDDLVDLCAGTGGFLLAGLDRIRGLVREAPERLAVSSEVAELARKSLVGQEIDSDVCALADAALRTRVGKATEVFVTQGDSLSLLGALGPVGRICPGKHKCAATNPPFGTRATVKDPALLAHYALARRPTTPEVGRSGVVVARPPDVLFLELNVRILAPGDGRLAIVLPYQILSGPTALYIRRWLLQQCHLVAVVDLPGESFQPYTGTKTALVVVRRRSKPISDPARDKGASVFMSMPRWVGHDRRGNAVYRVSPDGKPTGAVLCDFADVGAAFASHIAGADPSSQHLGSFAASLSAVTRDPLLRMNALFHAPVSRPAPVRAGRCPAASLRHTTVREVTQRVFCPGRFKRAYVDYSEGAVPFLGGADIRDLLVRTQKWLSPDDPRLAELRVATGWILITRSGSTGIVSSVPEAWAGYAMSEHIIRIVPDPKLLDPAYLLLYLQTDYAQQQLARGVFGSVIDEITTAQVADLDVLVPRSEATLDAISARGRESAAHRQEAIGLHERTLADLNSLLGR